MRAFTYERAGDIAAAAMQAASQPGAKFIAGGTNLLDLMKVEVERRTHLVDVSRLPLREIDETPDGGLRIGALVSNTDLAADQPRAPALSGAVAGAADRRLGPVAQPGDDGRQPAAAHALPLFLRRRHALQQAPAGQRLLGAGGLQPHARHPGRERRLHRRAPVRHGGRAWRR